MQADVCICIFDFASVLDEVMHAYMYAYMHTYIHICMHACIHTYTIRTEHTYICM
jgi:hypothetical protein